MAKTAEKSNVQKTVIERAQFPTGATSTEGRPIDSLDFSKAVAIRPGTGGKPKLGHIL